VPKNKQPKSDPAGLKPLPMPIELDLPAKQSPKKRRRLHEPEVIEASYDTNEPEPQIYEEPKKEREHPPEPKGPIGNRNFESAQKAYGQRRPRIKPPPKQKPPSRKRGTLGPRLGQGDRLYTPPIKKEPLLSPKLKRVLRFWAVAIVVIVFVVLGLMTIFRNNAWAVYLDDQFMGFMPINREIEEHSVHNDAVRHLSDFLGAEVQVEEVATIRTTRAGRRELYTQPEMIRKISLNFTYQIVATAIYIGNDRVALMRNQEAAEHVKDELTRRYRTADTISVDFEEDWRIERVTTESLYDLALPSEVIQLLERPYEEIIRHTIGPGENKSILAVRFYTTVDRISELNDIPRDAIIREGDTLLIEITRPRLTVVTIDETSTIEDIPMDIETVENHDLHVSITNTLEEGRYGEREVTMRITKINGNPVGEPELVNSVTLREPETRIVEVGTSDTIIEER